MHSSSSNKAKKWLKFCSVTAAVRLKFDKKYSKTKIENIFFSPAHQQQQTISFEYQIEWFWERGRFISFLITSFWFTFVFFFSYTSLCELKKNIFSLFFSIKLCIFLSFYVCFPLFIVLFFSCFKTDEIMYAFVLCGIHLTSVFSAFFLIRVCWVFKSTHAYIYRVSLYGARISYLKIIWFYASHKTLNGIERTKKNSNTTIINKFNVVRIYVHGSAWE